MITETPLKHVEKTFEKVKQGQLDTFALQYINDQQDGKVIVVLGEKARVEEFALNLDVDCIWVHGDLEAKEKVKRIQNFKNQDTKVLVGTKLVCEGIDIAEVRLVLLVGYVPPVSTYIQMAGRLRKAGRCVTLWNKRSLHKDSMRVRNYAKAIREFYGLEEEAGEESEVGRPQVGRSEVSRVLMMKKLEVN
ncbi:LANO_0F00122g1_1 [Lachancea nothofagi CBS 11611]|uniref:RNA helicase n=1 Tax=Lachancea nothofagi CBS 11611 TaxID=1266666 RepID=A0A1G4K525_9SACH|nr:LANO_0F00122g1_1 [Lachancea nothofagi CBS 11611]